MRKAWSYRHQGLKRAKPPNQKYVRVDEIPVIEARKQAQMMKTSDKVDEDVR